MAVLTVSAGDDLIAAAAEQAHSENTTLDELLLKFLEDYVDRPRRLRDFDEAMKSLQGKLVMGKKFTREELNER